MNRGSAKRIEYLNYALGGIATLVAIFLCSRPEVLGLGVGALLGALNFTAVRRIVELQIEAQKSDQGSGASAHKMILVFPKMMVLAGAMAVAVFVLPISVPFLAIGFSIFMLSIAIETVRFMTNPAAGTRGDQEQGL